MKVRELIEMLAKGDWDAEAKLDIRSDCATNKFIAPKVAFPIKSISSFRHKGKSYVTLNVRGV